MPGTFFNAALPAHGGPLTLQPCAHSSKPDRSSVHCRMVPQRYYLAVDPTVVLQQTGVSADRVPCTLLGSSPVFGADSDEEYQDCDPEL